MRLAQGPLLAALYASACGGSRARPHDLPAAAIDLTACPRDTIPETFCGRRSGETRCRPHGDGLAEYELSTLPPSLGVYGIEPGDAPAEAFRGFLFDRDATVDIRRKAAAEEADAAARSKAGLWTCERTYGTPSGGAADICCYSRCTPLNVGDTAAIDLSGDQFEPLCILPPPAGTSLPAREDAACPAGVTFGGVLLPYVSSQRPSLRNKCCYATPSVMANR
jgi:hypothetical protein